jgi:hypothetical protein
MSQPVHTPTPWGDDGDGFDSVAAQDFDTDGYCIFPVDEGTACGHICDLCDVEGDDEAAGNARLRPPPPLFMNAITKKASQAAFAFPGLGHAMKPHISPRQGNAT